MPNNAKFSISRITTLISIGLLFTAGGLSSSETEKPKLLAICGDSITALRGYAVYMEDYLLMCVPQDDIDATQFGYGGETATGFLSRQKFSCLNFNPTWATICYGMNDAGYVATDPKVLQKYTESLTQVIKQFREAGVDKIVLSSPGAVDFDFAKRFDPTIYNSTLADFGAGAKRVAAEQGVGFADIHGAMIDAMTKSKAKYGKDYAFGGSFDGVHPGPAGHLVMAYTFLKALGFDGDIGTITVDLKNNSSTATDGHKIISSDKGVVEVESSRYPFCFYGEPTEPTTASIIDFIPFNEELNRYMLVVKNSGSPKLKVTWDKTSRVYSADELEKGINLAADFLENPFSTHFKKVEDIIKEQQLFEVTAKELLCPVEEFRKLAPNEQEALDRIEQKVIEKDLSLRKRSREAVTPVSHSIKIEAAVE